MALVFQRNKVEFERTGVKGNIPNNDIAYLMYYLQCVCTSINCNNDPDIQRFTNYYNWSSLSIDEQRALVAVCYAFSPDVLADRVFFHSDTLCGERANEFYTINQVRNQLVAAESIIIAGRVRVNTMKFANQMKILLIFLFTLSTFVSGGPLSYAACQTACNKGAMTCYGIAGVTFGVGAVPACGLAQGSCMAACTPLLVAPTP
ncbi:unnamed protein product [Adineta steineri]|uniref:Uncharacterized protein n=1 Tax=Adineta steineri TaxID=433720 RepID=A0A819T3E1_9BILA|nr:unnamed protein product [Adineta steineri]CAF4072167.1 unnamed protein product [Adineta steineri]